ncbi:MAG: hypothetical protein A2X25_08245 [Chloroflexi bacterium GWB2_49_20]|nr:MAG: hypothetical protein A2X25_08245 [Chloroflexi bacterium GWB2_49_20]OGN79573.1 MAG: hypothetical protein A2X26_05780 [Chloroflexi bacterium GWC2_49_37]OGN84504.1 MAG: hypothetical protein A2X27_10750 [Chloroflexi bacterium GWD2_49_16]
MAGCVNTGPQAESKVMKKTSTKRCLGSIWGIVPEAGGWLLADESAGLVPYFEKLLKFAPVKDK